jgi:hypothetical protein
VHEAEDLPAPRLDDGVQHWLHEPIVRNYLRKCQRTNAGGL